MAVNASGWKCQRYEITQVEVNHLDTAYVNSIISTSTLTAVTPTHKTTHASPIV